MRDGALGRHEHDDDENDKSASHKGPLHQIRQVWVVAVDIKLYSGLRNRLCKVTMSHSETEKVLFILNRIS